MVKTKKVIRNGLIFQIKDSPMPSTWRFKDILGAGLGGGFTEGGIKGQSVQQAQTLTAGQRELLDLLTGALTGQFQGGQLQGVTPFQGTRPGEVPFSPLQQQGINLAGGFGPGISAGLTAFGGFDPQQGQQFLGQAGGALQRGLDFDPTQNILDALEPGRQLALNTFQQDIVPNLLERFGATSGASGPLNQALSEAGANLSLGLGAQAAPFLGQAALNQPGIQFQGAQLGAQLAGIPGQLAGQGAQLSGQGLQQLLGIGGLQQALPIGQARAEQQRFLESQPFSNPFLTQFGPLTLGTPAFENIAFQGFRDPSLLEKIAPIAGAAIGASDARVKDNVKHIDNALDKIDELDGKTYHFIFKPKNEQDAGIMAQDIEKVLPEAVTEIDGIKHVNYAAVVGLLVNAVKELKRKVG